MIKSLYPGYFQKSRVFLYPLLSINKKQAITPENTYLTIEGRYTLKDRKLILKYISTPEPIGWSAFKKDILFRTRSFESIELSEDGKNTICIFDFNFYKEDYDNVVNGKYSKMSSYAKSLIQAYYGYNTPEWGYMETFLLPERFFKLYSDLLGVEPEMLEVVGELASLPDLGQENLQLIVDKNVVSST